MSPAGFLHIFKFSCIRFVIYLRIERHFSSIVRERVWMRRCVRMAKWYGTRFEVNVWPLNG